MKRTHVTQFAHDIAVKVLEKFDQYGACKLVLARNENGHAVPPDDPRATCMCITGRIVNAVGDAPNGDDTYRFYNAPSVLEIAETVYGKCVPGYLYSRNDWLYRDVGPEALKTRTKKLFERIARLPVKDENPKDFRVGGTYENKGYGTQYTVTKILAPGEHDKYVKNESIVVYSDDSSTDPRNPFDWDPASAIGAYRRVA